ncbi:hypothetical protein RDI58_031012 [Solanum bulbocastanum]|uniref:Uncharacterized protein n=1 Tax=Solanum bulbocastanum TaxID=147425 RepID=A0AAN8XY86_SOLBU
MFHSGGNSLPLTLSNSALFWQILSNTCSNSGGALWASDLVEERVELSNGKTLSIKQVSQARQIANRFADPTTDKTPRPRARPNRAAQAASDKEADSQTEEAVATIAEVQHQEQPQAGGPAQEAAAEPVETGAKPGRANQGTQTVEQQPVIHSVNHMFFLLAKMVPLKQTKSREGTMAGISSPIRMRD